jgi:hypothetical protein
MKSVLLFEPSSAAPALMRCTFGRIQGWRASEPLEISAFENASWHLSLTVNTLTIAGLG